MELERKLREKGHESAAIQAALDRLERVGLIDDAEYVRAFVESRLSRRPVAMRVLRQQLRKRGVGDEVAERALAALDAEAEAEAEADAELEAAAGSQDVGGGETETAAEIGTEAEIGKSSATRRVGSIGERARATEALRPLLRRYRNLDPREARTRLVSALSRRGFDYDTIRDVLARALPGHPPEQ